MAYLYRCVLLVTASLAFAGSVCSPARAERTAIDQITDPNDPDNSTSVSTVLSGYCDLQGDQCGPSDGKALGYQVSFDGGTTFLDTAFVQSNGILTFGAPVDFFASVGPNGETLNELINAGIDPSLTSYGLPLVSAGQSNLPDFGGGGGFQQSARLSVDNSVINATFYTCTSPMACFDNPYMLQLTPTATGFQGIFDFSRGAPYGSDRGYVVNGQFTPTGTTFFLPATIVGLVLSPAPEPASWMLMIGGFGMIGGMLRRRGNVVAGHLS